MNKTITFLFAVCACTSLNAMDIKNLKVKAFGAARTGDKAALKAALNQSFDINSCTDSSPSLTLLGYAAFYDQGRIIKFLFKRGAKIYIPGTVNPLEHPILCKKIYTIDTLLQLGANVKPDKNFETNSGIIHTGIKLAQNFITAAKNQQFDVMEYLLQNGNADMFLNVTDDSGNTALHYATLHNRQHPEL